jgi:hypothetical protein
LLLRIGQTPSSVQQAMRASGVASHPAQTATWASTSASMSIRTEMRRNQFSTAVSMAASAEPCQIAQIAI